MPLGSSKDMSEPSAAKAPSTFSTSTAQAPRPRTICAFDLDNFYVACERLRNPALCGLPVGIQQKVRRACYESPPYQGCLLILLVLVDLLQQILATCSYEARASVCS